MTINERVSPETLDKIIESADEVITALAGTNEDVHKNDSAKMCQLWDDLNDRHATPAVVKALARELQQYRDAAEPVAFTEAHEISNMHATGLYLRAWPADRARNEAEGYIIPLYAAPQVTSVPDGIEAAARWVDAQREAYDDEHGRYDPDTGTFEFGNDAQLEYSATLAEIAEGIRTLRPAAAPAVQAEQQEPVSHPYTLPPHVYRELVNSLRDTAVKYRDSQQLRAKISRTLSTAIAPAHGGNSPVIPDGWIPVSERLPETDGNYWGWWSESKRQGPVWFIKSEIQAQFQSSEITHWMPLPAAPQQEALEVKK
ncbi:DUF551 domain-containing protein [Atlantibacter subterraneus]|uniref:DUF551 domain-containing protein n=1 Tax=Atlantibacter subterraneus TaxID=255519 RepID=UPI002FDE557D